MAYQCFTTTMQFTIIVVPILSLFGVCQSVTRTKPLASAPFVQSFHKECQNVCDDLSPDDEEPVCMMFSRYKRGYQYFVNLCHARRAICKENLLLHLVHASRCRKSNQFYMPVS